MKLLKNCQTSTTRWLAKKAVFSQVDKSKESL